MTRFKSKWQLFSRSAAMITAVLFTFSNAALPYAHAAVRAGSNSDKLAPPSSIYSFAIKKTGNKKLILYSGPSGVGKSSLMKQVRARYPDVFRNIVLYTSRDRRERYEIDGVDYHFKTRKEIEDLKKEKGDRFITCEVHDYLQGIDMDDIDDAFGRGQLAIAEVYIDFLAKIKKIYPEITLTFFIDLLTEDEIKERVNNEIKKSGKKPDEKKRKAISMEVITQEIRYRLSTRLSGTDVKDPMKRARSDADVVMRPKPEIDHVVVNDTLGHLHLDEDRWDGSEGDEKVEEFMEHVRSATGIDAKDGLNPRFVLNEWDLRHEDKDKFDNIGLNQEEVINEVIKILVNLENVLESKYLESLAQGTAILAPKKAILKGKAKKNKRLNKILKEQMVVVHRDKNHSIYIIVNPSIFDAVHRRKLFPTLIRAAVEAYAVRNGLNVNSTVNEALRAYLEYSYKPERMAERIDSHDESLLTTHSKNIRELNSSKGMAKYTDLSTALNDSQLMKILKKKLEERENHSNKILEALGIENPDTSTIPDLDKWGYDSIINVLGENKFLSFINKLEKKDIRDVLMKVNNLCIPILIEALAKENDIFNRHSIKNALLEWNNVKEIIETLKNGREKFIDKLDRWGEQLIVNSMNARSVIDMIDDKNDKLEKLTVSPITYIEDHQDDDAAIEMLKQGKLCLQMPFAGAGNRMESSLAKMGIELGEDMRLFNLDIWKIAGRMGTDLYKKTLTETNSEDAAKRAVEKAGLLTLEDIKENYKYAKHIGFGERSMLALEQGLRDLKETHNLKNGEIKQIFDRMTIVVSVSDDIRNDVLEIFKKQSKISGKVFFGFKPDNVVFVEGGYGTAFEFDDNNKIVPTEKKDKKRVSWNHGFAFIELAWIKWRKGQQKDDPTAYTFKLDENKLLKRVGIKKPVLSYVKEKGARYSCIHRINDLILMHPAMVVDVQMFGAFMKMREEGRVDALFEMVANPTGQKGGLALTRDKINLLLLEGLATKNKAIEKRISELAKQELDNTEQKRGIPYNRLYGYYDIEALERALLAEEMPIPISQDRGKTGILSPEMPTGDITMLSKLKSKACIRRQDRIIDEGILPNEQRDWRNDTIYEKINEPRKAYVPGSGAIGHDCKEAKYIKDGLCLVKWQDNPNNEVFRLNYYFPFLRSLDDFREKLITSGIKDPETIKSLTDELVDELLTEFKSFEIELKGHYLGLEKSM